MIDKYPDDPAFYWMHLEEMNIDDLIKDLYELLGIVSRDDGGIIAYANGYENANKIINALKLAEVVD